MNKLRIVGLVILGLIIAIVALGVMFPGEDSPKPVTQLTKAEYIALAIENTPETDTYVTKCFYSQYIDKYGVTTTLKFDVESQKESYVYTDEQLDLMISCL